MPLKIQSPAFGQGEAIPVKYTCEGENISPPLQWTDIPSGTESFAIIFEDPDAPAKVWVHWILYNIPNQLNHLDEHFPASEILTNGTTHGINDFQKHAYRGPCPPSDSHRYVLKLYALDTMLDLAPGANKKELLHAMEDHILDKAELMGRFARHK